MLLNADRPIEDFTDDELGVREFADALTDSILRMVPSSGFVIARPGKWGSGKSSTLKLISLRALHQEMAAWTTDIEATDCSSREQLRKSNLDI